MMAASLAPAGAVNEIFRAVLSSPNERETPRHANIAFQAGNNPAASLFFRRCENRSDPGVRRAGLRDDIAHEPDENDRKDENREIGVERG